MLAKTWWHWHVRTNCFALIMLQKSMYAFLYRGSVSALGSAPLPHPSIETTFWKIIQPINSWQGIANEPSWPVQVHNKSIQSNLHLANPANRSLSIVVLAICQSVHNTRKYDTSFKDSCLSEEGWFRYVPHVQSAGWCYLEHVLLGKWHTLHV